MGSDKVLLEDRVKCKEQKEKPTQGKPIVVLIGDSIREGYCEFVKENLSPEYDVYFPNDNCRFAQYIMCADFYSEIKRPQDVRLVHWNCGHWDVARFDGVAPVNSEEVYSEMVGRIQIMLEKRFPNAQIVFATTTPMNPNEEVAKAGLRSTKIIREYNEAAKNVIRSMNGTVNDLFDHTIKLGEEYYVDYCHYTEEGNKYLADCISKFIKIKIRAEMEEKNEL